MTSAGAFLAVSLLWKNQTIPKQQILDSSKVADDNFIRQLVLQKGKEHDHFFPLPKVSLKDT